LTSCNPEVIFQGILILAHCHLIYSLKPSSPLFDFLVSVASELIPKLQ
jgi:uncharacterized UPF0146 family protein